MLLRGEVDPDEAGAALRRAGYGWLDLRDNGALRRIVSTLELPGPPHVYHLAPRGVSKAAALRSHRERHGIAPEQAAAVGVAAADL